MIESLPPREPTRTRSHRRPLQQGAVAPLIKSSWLKVSAEKPRFVSVAGGCLSVFMVQPTSEIPSFYTLFRLALVCHDFLDPIIFFQRRGFHGAVMTLAVRGFVVLRIEDG
jgi:hypothetical protein